MKNIKDEILLAELIQKELDGALPDDKFSLLQEMLDTNPEALDYYIKTILTISVLNEPQGAYIEPEESVLNSENFADSRTWQLLAENEKSAPGVIIEKPIAEREPVKVLRAEKTSRKIPKGSLYAAVASIAAILFLTVYLHTHPPRSSVFVGTLEHTMQAEWEDPSGAIRNGCDLYVGPMRLKKGLAEILLAGGTQLIIEAPSEFTLESSSQMYLQEGRVTVLAENSRSPYVIRTPSSSIVDMGTEFGVLVDSNQSTMTHVYDGLVELRTGSDPLRYNKELVLTTNQAGRANPRGDLTKAPPQPGLFIRAHEYTAKAKSATGSAYHRWLEYCYQLRRDPDLMAYYTFESEIDSPDVLQNLSFNTAGKLNGVLGDGVYEKMPIKAQGRWPQKECLRFDRKKFQHIVVEHDPALTMQNRMSLSFWLFLENESSGGHLLSKRIVRDAGGNGDIEYQVSVFGEIGDEGDSMNSKKMQFGAGIYPGDALNYTRPIGWEPNQWHHVVMTFDGKRIIYYLDGRVVSTQSHSETMIRCTEPLRIGTDWPGGDPVAFDGLMGELAIFKRVISASEVQQMYQAGKPK